MDLPNLSFCLMFFYTTQNLARSTFSIIPFQLTFRKIIKIVSFRLIYPNKKNCAVSVSTQAIVHNVPPDSPQAIVNCIALAPERAMTQVKRQSGVLWA